MYMVVVVVVEYRKYENTKQKQITNTMTPGWLCKNSFTHTYTHTYTCTCTVCFVT